MEYYAHSANDEGKWELIEEHLSKVGSLCRQFLSFFSFESWGEILGYFHDLGKISQPFQNVLTGQTERVNHALPGAVMAYSCYCSPKSNVGRTSAEILAIVIACHHGELRMQEFSRLTRDILNGAGSRLDQENRTIALFGRDEYTSALAVWQKNFAIRKICPEPNFLSSEDRHLSKMLFVRFIFSGLIDADWSATADHFNPGYLEESQGPSLNPQETLQRLMEIRKEKQQQSTAASSLNQLRDYLFDACLAAGSQAPGLFTLTAPTGLGKTLSLLAFAVRQCMEHGKRRIIIVLPYLSIIEQNAREYRRIIPDLLEIHSQARWEEGNAALADRWDAPCVVTTAVSFFEPLFSSRPGDCRHLHQLANSVIVLDEAQSLPEHLLTSTLQTVNELCNHYGCTVLFSTATQPSFQYRSGLTWNPREIVPDPLSLFDAVRRVSWSWRVDEPVPWEEIASEMASCSQCCVIVNKKAQGRMLFNLMQQYVPEDALFYISTDLCAAHRSDVLAEIQQRLKTGMCCYLIATQCIEAGVDLDFPIVYRALAPLEAIIQAAGRCNRNGSTPDGKVIIFLPENDSGRLYPTEEYARAAMCTRTLLDRHGTDMDCSDLAIIDEYYQLLYNYGGGDKKKLREAIENEDYPEAARQYRMIEGANIQVIVPYDGRRELFDTIRDRLDQDDLSIKLLRDAREITVATYDIQNVKRYCIPLRECRKNFADLEEPNFYLLDISDFYDEKEGLHFDEPFDGIF